MVRSRAPAPNSLHILLLPFWLLRWIDEYFEFWWACNAGFGCSSNNISTIWWNFFLGNLCSHFLKFAYIVCKCFHEVIISLHEIVEIEVRGRLEFLGGQQNIDDVFPFKVFVMESWLEIRRNSPKYRFFHFTWWNQYFDRVVFIVGCCSTSNDFNKNFTNLRTFLQFHQSTWNLILTKIKTDNTLNPFHIQKKRK